MLVWWGSAVECIFALARLERDGALSSPAMTLALQRLQQLSAGWHEIDPSDEIRETAARFLRVHPLRAADALHLAAAFPAAERRPASLEIVTLDDHLANAARAFAKPVEFNDVKGLGPSRAKEIHAKRGLRCSM